MRERKRRERGITLIALVITIIIIIILSTITINLAFGDNGLIKMAEQARDEEANSTEYETEAMSNLVEYIDEHVSGMGNVTVPEEPEEEPVSADEIQKNPETYYGAELEGYECESSGVSTWRIFYADESNIYIIADDYIASEYAPTSTAGNSLDVGNSNYSLYFTNILNDYTGSSWIISNTNSSAREWLDTYLNVYPSSTNENIKAVAYLMDTDSWSIYAGSNAEYAIGGPTLELFCASYQDTHPSRYINNRVESEDGYKVKWSDAADSSYSDAVSGLTQDEYNSIYIKSDISKANGMWLASPSARYSGFLFYAIYNGNVDNYLYNATTLGLRPLVCLKSSVQIERVDEDTFRIVT